MKIHFVGVGGIGTSALARHFKLNDHRVTGSDISESEIISDLREMGIEVTIGHEKKNVDKVVDKVIYSPAVPCDNPELREAKRLNIKTKNYPEALGELTEKYFTIGISGTHGKSTTTSMAALVMQEAGLDPTVIVGTKLDQFKNSNYRKGDSKYLLIEADEWQGSLLNYSTDIAVLTNLEIEHLDYYEDLDHLIKTFQKYLESIGEKGKIVVNSKDPNLKKLSFYGDMFYFSDSDSEAKKVKKYLKVPGKHNLENAMSVYRLCRVLGVDEVDILNGISKYRGSWRRFQEKTISVFNKKQKILLDYAHHPTELHATLQAIEEKYFDKKVLAVYQPHQYQRSLYLKKDFVELFRNVSVDLLITDIYSVPGREKDAIKEKINSRNMVEEAGNENVKYISGSLKEIAEKLGKNLLDYDLIAIIGAGNIYKLEKYLKKINT